MTFLRKNGSPRFILWLAAPLWLGAGGNVAESQVQRPPEPTVRAPFAAFAASPRRPFSLAAPEPRLGSLAGAFAARVVPRGNTEGTHFMAPLPFRSLPLPGVDRAKAADDYLTGTGHWGSPYVPLDSWVYDAFDRLAALGVVKSALLGQRPWTRAECARLLREAAETRELELDAQTPVDEVLRALQREFAMAPGGEKVGTAFTVESIYFRTALLTDAALDRSLHFGSSVVNDWGRPFGQGFNGQVGFSVRAHAGRFSAYLQAEYQHAGRNQPLPETARALIELNDGIPGYRGLERGGLDRWRIVEANLGVTWSNYQLSFGKQALWWGPGRSGSMMMSTNAEPLVMLRLNRTQPLLLPQPLKFMGPVRFEAFVGQLGGHRYARTSTAFFTAPIRPRPYIHGERLSFKPTENLELGFTSTTVFGGAGYPLTLRTFFRSFSISNSVPGEPNDPGDRRAGFDFSYRVPGLRRWLTFYSDSFTEDEFSPIAYADKSAFQPGIYLSRIPGLQRADFRAEGAFTDHPLTQDSRGIAYFNFRFLDGYTNQQQLLAHWVGRKGVGLFLRSNYRLSPRERVQVGYRHQAVAADFLGGGGLDNAHVGLDHYLGENLFFAGSVHWERWHFPALHPGPRNHVTASFRLSFNPKWTLRK